VRLPERVDGERVAIRAFALRDVPELTELRCRNRAFNEAFEARRPRVITAGCSRKRTGSGSVPAATSAASERWSSHASSYGTTPRFSTDALRATDAP